MSVLRLFVYLHTSGRKSIIMKLVPNSCAPPSAKSFCLETPSLTAQNAIETPI